MVWRVRRRRVRRFGPKRDVFCDCDAFADTPRDTYRRGRTAASADRPARTEFPSGRAKNCQRRATSGFFSAPITVKRLIRNQSKRIRKVSRGERAIDRQSGADRAHTARPFFSCDCAAAQTSSASDVRYFRNIVRSYLIASPQPEQPRGE